MDESHDQEKIMAQNTQKGKIMEHTVQPSKDATSRRSFLRKGLAVAGAGTISAALVATGIAGDGNSVESNIGGGSADQ